MCPNNHDSPDFHWGFSKQSRASQIKAKTFPKYAEGSWRKSRNRRTWNFTGPSWIRVCNPCLLKMAVTLRKIVLLLWFSRMNGLIRVFSTSNFPAFHIHLFQPSAVQLRIYWWTCKCLWRAFDSGWRLFIGVADGVRWWEAYGDKILRYLENMLNMHHTYG